jgi:hypothetical protein
MLGYLRRHHLALIALFIALGGTSYAATRLPADSVGTSQIRNGAVTASKLSPAVRSVGTRSSTRTKAGWRDAKIHSQIAAAKERIRHRAVVTVAAADPWVNSGLSSRAGQRLWTTTRSDGLWSGNPAYYPFSDANGLPIYQGRYRVDSGAPVESLIGFVGARPVNAPEVSIPVGAPRGGPGGISNPGLLALGDTRLNYAPRTHGRIWLRNNDNTNYFSDVGHQIVEVIVTSGPS